MAAEHTRYIPISKGDECPKELRIIFEPIVGISIQPSEDGKRIRAEFHGEITETQKRQAINNLKLGGYTEISYNGGNKFFYHVFEAMTPSY